MCFFRKKKKQPEVQPEVIPEVKPEVKPEPVVIIKTVEKKEEKPEGKELLKLYIPENMYNDLSKWAAVEYRTLEEEVEKILALSLYRHDADPEMYRKPNRYQGYIEKQALKKAEVAELPASTEEQAPKAE